MKKYIIIGIIVIASALLFGLFFKDIKLRFHNLLVKKSSKIEKKKSVPIVLGDDKNTLLVSNNKNKSYKQLDKKENTKQVIQEAGSNGFRNYVKPTKQQWNKVNIQENIITEGLSLMNSMFDEIRKVSLKKFH